MLKRVGFKILEHQESFVNGVYGSKIATLLYRKIVPFATMSKKGQRCGCKCRIQKNGKDIITELDVVPFIELFNRKEKFLLSQGIGERWVDNRLTRDVHRQIMKHLQNKHPESGVNW